MYPSMLEKLLCKLNNGSVNKHCMLSGVNLNCHIEKIKDAIKVKPEPIAILCFNNFTYYFFQNFP